jgi:hypothetical protein
VKLFKYRRVDVNAFHELLTGELWHSKYAELNDPFDGMYINKANAGDLEHLISTLRVCCFSKVNDSLLMWSHYADSHRGICLEYDVDAETYKSRVLHVKYAKSLPILETIRRRADGTLEINLDKEARIFLTKGELWAYEQECRTLILSDNANEKGKGSKAPGPLTAIYFGLRSIPTTVGTINKVLSDRMAITFQRARLAHSEYQLEFDPIDRTEL